jgi:predicted transcriptional regulator
MEVVQPAWSLRTELVPREEKTRRVEPRRAQFEMYLDVMAVIASGVEKPTHIMYRANLSWRIETRLVRNLLKKGYIEPSYASQGRTVYRVTGKGMKLLELYKMVEDLREKCEI